jgi:hypothetical protein
MLFVAGNLTCFIIETESTKEQVASYIERLYGSRSALNKFDFCSAQSASV